MSRKILTILAHKTHLNRLQHKQMKKLLLLPSFLVLFTTSCKEDTLPKPQGYLRLEYPIAKYETYQANCPFDFGKNSYSTIKLIKDCDFNIVYPSMKASIHISYRPIEDNLDILLSDAQRLTYHHSKKAQSILEERYVNDEDKVYGMFYEIGGDAASATQFYLTDSINNFITGSVYFDIKPNADSLLPASEYIRNDVILLIESLKWKNQKKS
jgi:gliding motility-associated lipoprotein GldD